VSPLATAAGKVNPEINPNLLPNPNLYFRLTLTGFEGYTALRSPLCKKKYGYLFPLQWSRYIHTPLQCKFKQQLYANTSK